MMFRKFERNESGFINDYAYAEICIPRYDPINSLDLANSIRQVLTQRADLVTDEAVGRWAVQEMRVGKGKLYFSRSHLDSTPLHAAVRRDHPHAQEIVSKLNQWQRQRENQAPRYQN